MRKVLDRSLCASTPSSRRIWRNRQGGRGMLYATEQNLTDLVVERWGSAPDPRLREVVTALIKHLHAFVRKVEPTPDELSFAIDFLTRTGKMCTDKRQEFILLTDVLGVEMLVDAINNRLSSEATPTTIEGPFHVPGAPEMKIGENMAQGAPGVPCFVVGTVRSTDGKPIQGAELDVWQADGEGLYEGQRGDEISGPWMRGLYRSGVDGSYVVRTVVPIGYTIPMDGTVGELVSKAGISHMRPAHIHFILTAPGHKQIVTHLFRHGDQYLDTDAVFAVKEPLIVHFERQPPGRAPNGESIDVPYYVVRYDFVLQQEQVPAAA
jgi:hydroxyquinol 1,2-dioxygenase